MTTSNKNFKIKNGLEVLGDTATVNGNSVLTDAVIDVTNAAPGDALVYDGTTFTPSAVSAAGITPSDTAPANPQPKDLWVNTANNGLYYYYDDGNTSQWVQIGTTGPSGIITVSAPLSNSGTSSAAALTLDKLVNADISSSAGIAQSKIANLTTDLAALQAADVAVIKLNAQTISSNYSIPSGYNGMSAGPITIADGVTVTVPDGSAWSIV